MHHQNILRRIADMERIGIIATFVTISRAQEAIAYVCGKGNWLSSNLEQQVCMKEHRASTLN